MAIIWDSTPATASNGWAFRVGYEYSRSPSTITASTSSVVETVRIWVGTSMAVQDPISVSWSGSFGSGSATPTLNHTSLTKWSSSNQTLVKTLTRTVSPSYTSTTATSWSVAASGVYGVPGTSTVSGSAAVPKRPVSAPAAPTGLTVTRKSDTQHALSWSLPAASAAAPVTNALVQRRDERSTTWVAIATLGAVAGYTDTSTTAGHRYEWRVILKNSAGSSPATAAVAAYTTPAAPTGVKAVRQGADILLTWVKSVSPHHRTEIAIRPGDGAWTYPAWTSTGTSYLVKAPDPATVWTLAVKAEADSLGSVRSSSWALSNEVQLLAAPAAPTRLEPLVAEAGQPITLTWQHNAVDTTAQAAYELRWRARGETVWGGVPKTTGTASEHVVLAGMWASGTETEWQVRTWGDHAEPSPWSALALTAVSERPSVTLTAPLEQVWPSSSVTVRWDYSGPEGSAQAGYLVRLMDLDGTVLWQYAASSPVRSVSVRYRLEDEASYVVGVAARDPLGLWSDEVTQRIDVSYAPPPTAALSTQWDQDAGVMVLTVTHPAPAAGEVEAVSCTVERATTGGDWVVLEEDLDLETTVVDRIPPVGAVAWYRVRTVSELPSTAETDPVGVEAPGRGWIYLNGGPGWARMVRLRDNARLGRKFTAEKELFQVAGRKYPISIQHEGRAKSIDVQVSTDVRSGGATYGELEAFLDEVPDPICYRDATGDRFFCSISGVSGGRQARWAETASFTVTRIDHAE